MNYTTIQPRQGHVRPLPRRLIAEMNRRLTEGPEWATAATVDAAKVRPRQPLDGLTIYLHESAPDPARHPQLAIVAKNLEPVSP